MQSWTLLSVCKEFYALESIALYRIWNQKESKKDAINWHSTLYASYLVCFRSCVFLLMDIKALCLDVNLSFAKIWKLFIEWCIIIMVKDINCSELLWNILDLCLFRLWTPYIMWCVMLHIFRCVYTIQRSMHAQHCLSVSILLNRREQFYFTWDIRHETHTMVAIFRHIQSLWLNSIEHWTVSIR